MRPEILNSLFRETQSLKGVGKALMKPLEKLHLLRSRDLVYHRPNYWVHRKAVKTLDEGDVGQIIIIQLTATEYRGAASRGPFRVHAIDQEGNQVSLIYFGGKSAWPKKLFPLDEPKIVSGKLDRYGDELQIVHPEHVVEPKEADSIAPMEAVYPLSDGLGNKRLSQLIMQVLEDIPDLPEWIEPSFLARQHWPGWRKGLSMVHSRENSGAEDRLAYDEIFANQLALMMVRASRKNRKGFAIGGTGKLRDSLSLPFAMTGAQQRCVDEITGDLAQATPMLRLLQGDVGSGKTVVALMAMLTAIESGYQAALLAPTEILARQHFDTLRSMAAGTSVNIEILTGRDKGKARESTLMGLADGSIDILVGTHAIFQDKVQYKDLALVIIDEQHRFGVSQRLMLSEKAKRAPHLLAMTATPIPRTLMLSQYGEMDVSRIDELPPGRQPIETRVMSEARLESLVAGLGRHMEGGGQAYWVCPLVEESEKLDVAAAEDRAAQLRQRFGDKIGLIHGRMKGEEKDAVMARFQSGALSALVATTVIEVGVDVPNASLMIIEAADRFGLAQLHQLRGRVGRGSVQSNCILVRGEHLSETARARLALMRETNDGFLIAEEDLKLRGSGEILGTRQSGDSSFRCANPEQIGKFIDAASDDAKLLLHQDENLTSQRGEAARVALYLFERDFGVKLLRSG